MEWMVDFKIELIYSFLLYSLPIVIYRYAVRKAPVELKHAKKITIIYGVCAFLTIDVSKIRLGT